MTNEHILETLRHPGKEIPDAELAEVIARKEEFAPLLIAEIERVTQAPEAAHPDDNLAAYALYLLAEMGETRALQPALDLLALDANLEDLILGDITAQNGAQIMGILGRDQPEVLREFVMRPGRNPWPMAAALNALALQVRWGWQPREGVVAFFQELLEANQFLNDVDAWSIFVNACYELHPSGLLEGIRGLYEREVIDEFIVGPFEYVEAAAREDPAELFARPDRLKEPTFRTAEAVEWWNRSEGGELDSLKEDDDFLLAPELGRLGPNDISPVIDLPAEPIRVAPKIGRNELCPCGSGKKYKKCCLPAGG